MSEQNNRPQTRSYQAIAPNLRLLTRLGWIFFSLSTFFFFVQGTRADFSQPLPVCTQPESDCIYWDYTQADREIAVRLGWNPDVIRLLVEGVVWLVKLAFVGLATALFWRKSDDWTSLLISIMFISFTLEGVSTVGFDFSPGTVLYFAGTLIFLCLPFIFPDGHFEPPWMRWGTGLILLFSGVLFFNFDYAAVILTIWLMMAFFAVAYRYTRVSNLLQRQQLKWVMGGIFGWGFCFLILWVGGSQYPPADPSPSRLMYLLFFNLPLYSFSLFILPLSLSIAILRYRLWDIDLIIRRTLIYGALTGSLALIYFLSVVLLQRILPAQSQLTTVVSTLSIAGLFNPFRIRIQRFIDRRFYRQKYDAAQTIVAFNQTIRAEVDLERLSAALLSIVDETMKPGSVALWMREIKKRDEGSKLD